MRTFDSTTESASDPSMHLEAELVRHATFVRRLAVSLVGDRHAAEDVAQEATVLCLLHPPQRVAALRSWLATTARRLVRRRQRESERRLRREEVAAGRELEVGAGDDAAAEVLGALTHAVLALPEPYRHTVLCRFHRGLTPAEIAAADGVALATVHSRLRRALHQLRARLDRERPGGRAAWTSALLPFGAIPPLSTAIGVAPVAKAVTLMTAKQSICGAAMLVAALLLAFLLVRPEFAWLQPGAGEIEPTLVADDGDVAAIRSPMPDASIPAPIEVLRSTDNPPPPAPADEDSPQLGGVLEVRVTWREDGQPAAGRGFQVISWGDHQPARQARELATDDSGTFVVRDLHAGRVAVYGHIAGDGGAEIRDGETSVLHIELSNSEMVSGRIVDEGDRAIADAELWLSDYGNDENGRVVARTGSDGRFAIRGVESGRWIGAIAAGFQPSLLRHLDSAARPLEFRLVAGGASLRGTVTLLDGAPLAMAQVQVQVRPDSALLRGSEASHAVRETRVNAAGMFEFEGLPPGPAELLVRAADEHAPHEEQLVLEAGRELVRDVTLGPSCRLACTVIDVGGRPVAGAAVRSGVPGGFLSVRAETDVAGRLLLSGLPAGRQRFEVQKQDFGEANAELSLLPGAVTEWCAVLDPGHRVHGRIVDGENNARRDCTVYLVSKQTREDGRILWSETDRCENGSFSFTHVPNAPFRLEVSHERYPGQVVRRFVRERPDGEELRIVIEEQTLEPGRVHGLLIDSDGYPPPRACQLELSTGGLRWKLAIDAKTGAFTSEALFAGAYDLSVSGSEFDAIPLSRVEVEAGVDLDLGRLQLPAFARLQVRTDGVEGLLAPYDNLLLQLQSEAPSDTSRPKGVPLRFTVGSIDGSRQVPAGTWEWVAEGRGLLRQAGRLELRPDALTELDLTPKTGEHVRFSIRVPADTTTERGGRFVRLEIRGADGRVIQNLTVVPARGGEPAEAECWLSPGEHVVEAVAVRAGIRVEDADLHAGPEAFQVPVGGLAAPMELRLR